MGQPSPFTSPAAPGVAGVAPKIYELAGCLVAFSPTQFTKAGEGDNKIGYEGDEPRDRITTNIFLLETPNGQPITIGRSSPSSAPTDAVVAPARFQSVWMSADNIVRALAPGGQALVGAMILGRVIKSDVGKKPWNLIAVDGTPDMDKAISIWSALQMGQLAYNEPTPLAAPAAANTVQYGAPVGNGYAPSPVPPQPTAWTVPPVAQPYAQGTIGYHNPDPTANRPVPAFAAAAPPVPQPPAPPTKLPLTPALQALGWTQPAWDGLTLDQQNQVVDATPGARV